MKHNKKRHDEADLNNSKIKMPFVFKLLFYLFGLIFLTAVVYIIVKEDFSITSEASFDNFVVFSCIFLYVALTVLSIIYWIYGYIKNPDMIKVKHRDWKREHNWHLNAEKESYLKSLDPVTRMRIEKTEKRGGRHFIRQYMASVLVIIVFLFCVISAFVRGLQIDSDPNLTFNEPVFWIFIGGALVSVISYGAILLIVAFLRKRAKNGAAVIFKSLEEKSSQILDTDIQNDGELRA